MRKPIKREKVMAEINITPFTDVVLVLLIIFMISTPLMLQPGITVKLPKTASSETQSGKNLTIMITNDGKIFLDKNNIELEQLGNEISNQLAGNPGMAVVINADKDVRYDNVVRVLDIAKQSGAKKLALGIEYQKK